MKKIITLALSITLLLVSLTSCGAGYEFQYAFFPIDVANDYVPADDIDGSAIDVKYENLVVNTLTSLTNYINDEFNMDLDKPIPDVKSYTPHKDSIVASYHKGTIFVNENAVSEYWEFFIVHELIHYLSDVDGNTGFTHLVEYNNYTVFVGYGITEGYADILAYKYCEENGIATPDLANLYYNNNERVAAVYYLLEPETMHWYLMSDHESMSNFVKENVEKVAKIPNGFKDNFDFHFYATQDLLLDCSSGNIQNDSTYALVFKASFEMASITARASEDKTLKENIYENVLSTCDNGNVIKNMILG